MPDQVTAEEFVKQLRAISSPDEIEKVGRFFREDGEGASSDNKIMGVSIGKVFPVAKKFASASLSDVERLLESPYYEVRMGAVATSPCSADTRPRRAASGAWSTRPQKDTRRCGSAVTDAGSWWRSRLRFSTNCVLPGRRIIRPDRPCRAQSTLGMHPIVPWMSHIASIHKVHSR